jgi:hypothetical protein
MQPLGEVSGGKAHDWMNPMLTRGHSGVVIQVGLFVIVWRAASANRCQITTQRHGYPEQIAPRFALNMRIYHG